MTSMESRCQKRPASVTTRCHLWNVPYIGTNEVPILWYFVWIILYYDIHIYDKECKASVFLSFFTFMLDLMTPYYLHSILNNGFQMPGQNVVMWYFIYISVIHKDVGRLDFSRETWSVGLPVFRVLFTFPHTLVRLLYIYFTNLKVSYVFQLKSLAEYFNAYQKSE
jgi:hypothetical protein